MLKRKQVNLLKKKEVLQVSIRNLPNVFCGKNHMLYYLLKKQKTGDGVSKNKKICFFTGKNKSCFKKIGASRHFLHKEIKGNSSFFYIKKKW